LPLAVLAAKGGRLISPWVGLGPDYGPFLGAHFALVIGFWLNYVEDQRAERRKRRTAH
jgi:hypothetical protein